MEAPHRARAHPPDALRAPLRAGGVVALAMVAAPLVMEKTLDARRLAAWCAVSAAFLVALWLSTATQRLAPTLALLALQAALVAAMVLLLCDGFEGALLVIVSIQLAARVSRRTGVTWIVLQTTLLATAIGIHWSPRPAFMLGAPYLGFQLLVFFVSDVLAREAHARALTEDNARLAERVRIARELHDAVGHHLTALSLHLEAAAPFAESDRAREPIITAQSLVRSALRDVREVVAELRDGDGGDRLDLPDALRTLAADVPRPRVHLVAPESLRTVDGERALTLLRCAQEIVTNSARHGDADNLWIDLVTTDGAIELVARDDGKGAGRPLRVGHGLRGMRERLERAGGSLEIADAPREGFSLRAFLPAPAPGFARSAS